MDKTAKGVTRDTVDPEALALLRSNPAEYIRATHRQVPFGFASPRPADDEGK